MKHAWSIWLLMLGWGMAQAAEPGGTLKKIRDSGTVVVATRQASIPFSFPGPDGQPIGYSIDISQAVIEQIKKELKRPNLKVVYKYTIPEVRIPWVRDGLVDFECATTTNNRERQREVAFSLNIFQVGTRLLTRKNSGIRDFADLAGRKVVTVSSSTSERLLLKLNTEQGLGMHLLLVEDMSKSFEALQAGQAEALMMDDVLLAGEMTKARDPNEWAIVGKPQSYEVYGCLLRKGDPAFKALVDRAIRDLYHSGRIYGIYSRWFQQPLPGSGLNLGFPMSPELKALIATPSDQALD